MRDEGLKQLRGYIKTHRLQKRWQRIVTCLAAVVVFCTTYALILPAITMEKEPCQIPEHTHSEACYTQVSSGTAVEPVCSLEKLDIHQHTADCYDGNGNPVCGYSDFVVHEHDSSCYGEDGNLWCPLPEIKTHTHDESCYAEAELGHMHTETCYTQERGSLICGSEEDAYHQHTDDCYTWEQVLNCGLTETEAREPELVCGKAEIILHTHTDECYEDILDDNGEVIARKLICGKLQVVEHVHNADCFQTAEESADTKTLTCGLEEHTHTEECNIPVELTEEEQAQVEDVIALIDALPAKEEIEETLAAFEDVGDEDSYGAYLAEVLSQAKAAYEAYAALTGAQQEQVTNVEKLMALEPLWSAQTLNSSDDGNTTAGENGFYVSALSINSTLTGTTTYWDDNDNAGNDSSAANDIIRTFDTIAYTFDASINNEQGNTGDKVKLWLEITLDKDMTEAMFDPDYFKDLDEYTITYYGKNGNEVAQGTNGLPNYSANTNASGSDSETPYRTEVTRQVLSGWMEVSRDGDVASFTQTMKAGISVKAACNGDTIQPHFCSWTEGQNEEARKTVDSKVITVSAAANYNVALTRSTTLAYESSFDMDAGTEATENTSGENKVDGIMLAYCVTFQLYNEDEYKGLMGIELPRGDISADISFEESAVSTSDQLDFSKNFTPILWDYRTDGNATNETKKQGAWGRNLYWGGIENTARAHWAAPGNKLGSTAGSCYYGGTWSMNSTYKDSWKGTTGTSSGPYTMTVSGYDFDLDSFIFPDRTQGTTTVVYKDNIGCFSAGYLEVLLQYDNEQIDSLANSTSIYMRALVENFKATSMSSQATNNVTEEMKDTDNSVNAAITVKNPGTIDKLNTIAKAAVTRDIASNYMGIAGTYWTGECGDPATFAGSEIHLAGQFYLSSDAGVMITDFNYLQVFDSSGFSIMGVPQVATRGNITIPESATTTFLYAADPDYPGGYDSNTSEEYTDEDGKKVASAGYMYKVRESDLIYFSSLEALEKAGYTCVGIMLEARGIEMKAYGWSGLTVPVKIDDDENVIGKTICTVNRVTAWTDNKAANLTWGKATTESGAKANAAEVTSSEIYKNPRYRLDTQDVVNANGGKASRYDYKKTEYKDGSIVTGTHLNGKYGGMSILVLGYKASLALDTVDGKDYYSLGKNERTAEYVISNIQTELESGNDSVLDSGTPMTTDLTITITLDQGLTLDLATLSMDGKQILSDTYAGSEDVKREYTYIDNNGDKQTIKYSVYYTYDAASQTAIVQIKGVPVGVPLDNITFSAAIGEIGSDNDVTDGSKLTVEAKITGAADRRAYSEAAGNLRTKTIEVSNLTGTSLVKTVDHSYIELDGSLTYTLKYTNSGTETMSNALYLYDIMPVKGDSRGSDYTDASENGQVGITKISARVTGGGGGDTSAKMRVYYSMVPGTILNRIIDFRGFPENDINGSCLRQLLGNALVDESGNIYFFQMGDSSGGYKNVDLYTYSSAGVITARNFELDKDNEGNYLYTVNKLNVSYSRFARVTGFHYENNELVIDTVEAAFEANTYTKLFRYLGDITPGSDGITDSAGSLSVSDFTHATCIFAAAVDLGAGETINFEIGVQTNGNQAANLYGNTAHSWISGTPLVGELDSNMVMTRAVSRTISGEVWYDSNLNGIQDAGEAAISDVECTLFKWDEALSKYVACTSDVTGSDITPVTTGEDGRYCFEKLAAGDYIVAFSGNALNKYTGATFYQKNGVNDSNTNDGIALIETKSSLDKESSSLAGIDNTTYKYAIAYRLSDGDSKVEKLALHTIYDASGNLQITQYLNNYTEQYSEQNLGLIIAGHELPMTGGSGTIPYTIGGLLLLAGAGILLLYNNKKRGKEDLASS